MTSYTILHRTIPRALFCTFALCGWLLLGCNQHSSPDTDADTDLQDSEQAHDTALDTAPLLSAAVPDHAAPLVADGHYFRDADGAAVFLRGINVAGDSKVPPFTAITGKSQLAVLPELGFNTLRLLFNWEAFEPDPGNFNADYLEWYEQVVDWAHELDMYVVVDFHQDAYSRYTLNGCGEGFPAWTIPPDVDTATPDNGEACSDWGIQMASSSIQPTIWTAFHSDQYGAKSAYLSMVETVATTLLGHPNIIGYELLNEPWGSDAELHEFFTAVGTRIRQAAPDTILFIPAHALVSGGVRADTVPKPDFHNMAYSPHFYDGVVLILNRWTGNSPSGQLDTLLAEAKRWNMPMFLSEFGAPAEAEDATAYMAAQLNWLQRRWVSFAQWNYTPNWQPSTKDGWNMEDLSIIDNTGQTRNNFVLRPGPLRIGGQPIRLSVSSSEMSLLWNNRSGYGPTEIFVPTDFQTGKTQTVTLEGTTTGTCTADSHTIHCAISGDGNVQWHLQ